MMNFSEVLRLIPGKDGQISRSTVDSSRLTQSTDQLNTDLASYLTTMMNFRENYGQIFSSRDSSVNSETPATTTASAWPNMSAQGFNMDMANSSLWDDKMESPPAWSSEKVESPLWDTDVKDPSCTWDLDLSHQLAAKLLMIDDQPSQVVDQQIFGQNSFTYAQDMSMVNTTANPRFKTEICRNFKEKGTCLYGDLCQFAHGKHELRRDVARHAKYKTKLCQKYWIAGYCAYGPRCNFIHQEIEREAAMRLLAMSGAEARGGAVYRALRPLIRPGSSQAAESGGSSDSEDQTRGAEGVAPRGPPNLLDYYSEPPRALEVSEVTGLLPANFGLFTDFPPAYARRGRGAIGSERGGARESWSSASGSPSTFAQSDTFGGSWRGYQ